MVENYNSMDLAAFKNVWVFCEQRQGKMMPTTFELISEGRKLADELGVNLCGLLLGDNVEGIAKELGASLRVYPRHRGGARAVLLLPAVGQGLAERPSEGPTQGLAEVLVG